MRVAVIRGPNLNTWEAPAFQAVAASGEVQELMYVGSIPARYRFSPEGNSQRVLRLPTVPALGSSPVSRLTRRLMVRTIGDWQVLFGLKRLLKSQSVDVVHTAELHNYYTLQCVRARKQNLVRAVVATIWENCLFPNEPDVRWKLSERVLPEVDHFIAATSQAREYLLTRGADPRRITTIPPGVRVSDWAGVSETNAGPDSVDRARFVVVARLVWEKGIHDALAALRYLEHRFGLFPTLSVVGDGAYRTTLERFAVRLGVADRVTFLGHVSHSEIPRILASATGLILPSLVSPTWQEQFGYVLVEAMSAGIPVIASSAGAIPEVVDDTGYLYQSGDYRSLAESMSRLVGSPDAARLMAEAGRTRAKQTYAHTETARRYLEVYKQSLRLRALYSSA